MEAQPQDHLPQLLLRHDNRSRPHTPPATCKHQQLRTQPPNPFTGGFISLASRAFDGASTMNLPERALGRGLSPNRENAILAYGLAKRPVSFWVGP